MTEVEESVMLGPEYPGSRRSESVWHNVLCSTLSSDHRINLCQ